MFAEVAADKIWHRPTCTWLWFHVVSNVGRLETVALWLPLHFLLKIIQDDRSFGIGLANAAYFSMRFCKLRWQAADRGGISSLLWISTKFTSCVPQFEEMHRHCFGWSQAPPREYFHP